MHSIIVFVETVWQDLKYGLRQLRRNPGFTAVAALTLALGIGANTSLFSLLNALLLRPLAVPENAAVVGVYRGNDRPSSYPDFLDLQQRVTAFSALAAGVTNESALDIGNTSEVILAEAVSYNYPTVLQVRPALGRWFSALDETAADQFIAVISHRVWERRLGGDPQIIGKQVRLESQWYTVIGVAPKDFPGMAQPILTGIWVPLVPYARHNSFASRLVTDRHEGRVMVFGRLKPGVTVPQAQAQLNAADLDLRRQYPYLRTPSSPLQLVSVRGTTDSGYRRMVRQMLTLLMALGGLVLLIACANVANLLLARGVARRHEISIRLALGASRARLGRQTFAESLLLSLLGAAAGLAAAHWTNRLLERAISSAPSPIAVGVGLSFDGRVFAFVLIASILTTVIFAMMPAFQASKTNVVSALQGSEVFARNRRLTLRNLNAVAQVALSLVLLITAGLFLRALHNAGSIDPGFDPRGLLSARLFVPKPTFNEVTGRALYRRIVEHTRSLPGVRNATLSYAAPMMTMTGCVTPETDQHAAPSVTAGANVIGPNYFATLGIPVLRGRDFGPADNVAAPPVVIVNETLARRYWPGRGAVGNRVRVGPGCDIGRGASAEIVGVVQDAQYASLEQDPKPYVFFPLEQRYAGFLALLVHTENDPSGWATVLRRELHGLDDRLRIYETDTLANQMDKTLWQTRWEATLLVVFAVLALLIASVGVYGVIAFAARQRTREFGIRMALGAQRRDILRLVIGDALLIALAGVGLGLLASLACTHLLRSFLFGLSPTDPASFAGAALLWTALSLIASSVPAWQSTRVAPSKALRHE
ncbi:MAG TPA: ABC transporter permease [Paludibaculum sp.]|jgi:putative ABC transport system permease protein